MAECLHRLGAPPWGIVSWGSLICPRFWGIQCHIIRMQHLHPTRELTGQAAIAPARRGMADCCYRLGAPAWGMVV